MRIVLWILIAPVTLMCSAAAHGQIPAGTLSGTITDQSGAIVAAAAITVRQPDRGIMRPALSDGHGVYRIENLAPGDYEIEVQAPRFKTSLRTVTLRVGDNLSADFVLEVGGSDERVEVHARTSVLDRTDYKVGGTIERAQIESLPLNGRSFLELAQLQPAVNVVSVTNPGALGNNFQQVLVAGAYYSQTRIAVDGSTIGDRYAGGTTQGFSQESVQEFQISTFNLDPATSVGGSGAINIVTRRGTDDVSGSAFFFYRDHALAAYPRLLRDPRAPSPYFARRQAGAGVGGPIKRERLYWFANYERNSQDGVFVVANNHPIFSKFDGIYPNPLRAEQFNLRVDGRVNDRHQGVLRVSMEKNDTTTPAAAIGLPSNWQAVRNRAFQVQTGLTSILSPHAVHDLRVAYNYLGADLDPIAASECRDPVACIGAGGPNITVFDAPSFRIGNQMNSPFARWQRMLQIVDHVTWQRGKHRIRAGAEWEHAYLKGSLAFQEPAQIVLWGPSDLQSPALHGLYEALPVSLRDPAAAPPTFDELLQLPLRSFTTGIGNPSLPGSYNSDDASRNDRFRVFVQDAWRARSNVTISFGLAYAVDTNLFAHDLDYPAYLAPIVGPDLSPPRRDTNNFAPSFGMVWTPGATGRTVVRGGAGIYYDEDTLIWKLRERAFIGPSGNGRVVVDGSVTGLTFTSTPTTFTGADLLPLLPGLRSDLAARLGTGTDLSVRGIDVIKQGDQIVAPDATTAYSIHATAGIQREVGAGLVVSADYVTRRYVHVGPLQGVFALDRNRFNRPRVTGVDPATGAVSFVRDPVIPVCSSNQAQALNPADACSTGPINIFSSGANFRYQGLHLRVDKRYSSGWQFSAGYALSKNVGFIDGGFTSFDDYRLAYGNIPNTRRHRLTLSGIWTPPAYHGSSRLLKGALNAWTLSFISQTFSAPPLNTLLNGLDLDGDGISLTLLPGTTHNNLGQGLNEAELRALVDEYNAGVEAATRRVTNPDGSVSVIRPRTPFNQIINPLVLPETLSNGDSFITQDVRVTKRVSLPGPLEVSLIAEVFNIFNVGNLTGYSGVLNQPNYGQPSARVGQVFGTGGARAFQFAARLVF